MLVREQMPADPLSGALHVFRAQRADRVKLIYWDGAGLCLLAKRLEDGRSNGRAECRCAPAISGLIARPCARLDGILPPADLTPRWREYLAGTKHLVTRGMGA